MASPTAPTPGSIGLARRSPEPLRIAAVVFAVALLVHGADHLRRGMDVVTPEVFWLGNVQLVEEKVRDDVERAERGAEVPRSCALDGHERVEAAHIGEQRESGVLIDVRASKSVELWLGDEAQIRHLGQRP